MNRGETESTNREDHAELSAKLVHEVSTPMAIAKVNLEIISRYLPVLLSVYQRQSDTLSEAEKISPEHLHALAGAPLLIEEQCRAVENSVKSHWRAATGKNVGSRQFADASIREDGLTAQGLRILVVEDESVHQDIALKVLSTDHQVEVIANAREALQRCEARPFDLILLDICLPDLDGRQMPKLIRRTHPKGLYIAALTNYPTTEEELRQAGFDAQLEKPLKPEAFRQFLRQASPVLQRES